MSSAYHETPYPSADGQVAGELPTCSGSTFDSFCVESVAKTAWSNLDFRFAWGHTPSYHPYVSDKLYSFVTRMQLYMSSLGIFSDLSISRYVLS